MVQILDASGSSLRFSSPYLVQVKGCCIGKALSSCNTVLVGNENGFLTSRCFNLLISVRNRAVLFLAKVQPILTSAAIRVPLVPQVFLLHYDVGIWESSAVI